MEKENYGVIDCHAHITPNPIKDNGFKLKNTLDRCSKYNIEAIIYSLDCSNGDIEIPIGEINKIAEPYDVKIRFSLGYTPPYKIDKYDEWENSLKRGLEVIEKYSKEKEVVAIGEIGLDYHWLVINYLVYEKSMDFKEAQEIKIKNFDKVMSENDIKKYIDFQHYSFKKFIEKAKELDLPIVIHERDSTKDAFQIIKESGINPKKVMFHCFAGNLKYAQLAMERNYFISIPSSVGARGKFSEIAKKVDLSYMLLETDSPYHSPIIGFWKHFYYKMKKEAINYKGNDKYNWIEYETSKLFHDKIEEELPNINFELKGKSGAYNLDYKKYFERDKNRYLNESTFVAFSPGIIANLKNISKEEVKEKTTLNARNFFKI